MGAQGKLCPFTGYLGIKNFLYFTLCAVYSVTHQIFMPDGHHTQFCKSPVILLDKKKRFFWITKNHSMQR